MTSPTTQPPPADAPDTAPTPAGPTGILRVTAVIATVGVVVALLGIGIGLLPVHTPTQDCGTSLVFVLSGRVDEFVSETDPPAGITPAEARANNADPCRSRVADRSKPASVLIGVGLLAAVGAALTELAIRFVRWRRRGDGRAAAVPEPAERVADEAPRC